MAVCVRGGDTSSRRWLQSWSRFSTTAPHGDRGRPGQGGGERETNYTATLRMFPPRQLVPSILRWTPGRPAPLLEVLPQERAQQRTWWPIAPCVCAAGGGTVGGHSRTSRFPCCRTGHRSAQDRKSTPRCSHSPPCAADGKPVGGSANYGARTLPFQFLLVVKGETQIFKVFSEDKVQHRIRLWNAFLSKLWSRRLSLLLLVEVLQIG